MKTATPVALLGALFSVLCSPFSALAVEPPRLVTWELDPFAQTTENVVAALARVTPQADGGYVIDVAFDMEPSRAPTLQFLFSSSGGRTVSVLCEEAACTFPTQSMTLEGRWTYGYTIPAPTFNGKTLLPGRVAPVKRCRFGGAGGRRLEGGGYMVVAEDGFHLGRDLTVTLGGQTLPFKGGVLLDPASLNAVEALQSSVLRSRGRFAPSSLHAPFSVLRGREADASSPTSIRGKHLSFPVPLKKGSSQSDTEASTETHRGA